jgi:hypothetical protein
MNPTNAFLTRRRFIKTSTAAALGGALASRGRANESANAMEALYGSLSAAQKKAVCFDWDHRVDIQYGRKPLHFPDPKGVLLRTHVSNAWKITEPLLGDDFYTDAQRALVLEVMKTVLAPGWTEKLQQQGEDDYGQPWGGDQALAFFGTPGSARFQCVITGFHLTLRAGSDANPSTAFGGAISHGHQPTGFFEETGHPRNIWWYQSTLANQVYARLDDKQRQRALHATGLPFGTLDAAMTKRIDRILRRPAGTDFAALKADLTKVLDRSTTRPGLPRNDRRESEIRFRGGKGAFPGLPVAAMARDQREGVEKILAALLEPYRQEVRDQVLRCLQKQGGLEKCSLAFYQQFDMGGDGEWDNWRLEGPSFVWYFRGAPHVHIWIHVADDPSSPVSSYLG